MKKEIIKKLPKVDLHCHLDGSLPRETIKKLADQQNIAYPKSEEAFYDLITAPSDCQNLLEYLTRFDFVLALLQTKEALQIAAYELLQAVHKENVRYIEVRFAPLLSTQKGLTVNEVVTAVLTGLAEGQKAFGVQANALLCGMKHFSAAENQQTLEAAQHFSNTGVAGFDLAGDEAGHPQSEFDEITRLARKMQIPLTLHAGECGCPHNIATALKQGARRIGHGIAADLSPEIMQQCAEAKVTIEMCPTSNFQTKACLAIADYPFRKFYDAGLKVTINTDNRTVSNTSLTKEFLFLHQHFGINYEDMKQLNLNSLEGAFLPLEAKIPLRTEIENAYAPLLNTLEGA